jgi:hypothetical protein
MPAWQARSGQYGHQSTVHYGGRIISQSTGHTQALSTEEWLKQRMNLALLLKA